MKAKENVEAEKSLIAQTVKHLRNIYIQSGLFHSNIYRKKMRVKPTRAHISAIFVFKTKMAEILIFRLQNDTSEVKGGCNSRYSHLYGVLAKTQYCCQIHYWSIDGSIDNICD